MFKRGKFFYSEYKGVKLRASQEYQINYLIRVLKIIENKGIPIHKKHLKRIYLVRFSTPIYGSFDYERKEMSLNSTKYLFPPRNRLKKRSYLEQVISTITHELIHAYDKKDRLTNLFYNIYKDFVVMAGELIDPNVFFLTTKKDFYENGLPIYRSNKRYFDYKEKYSNLVKKKMGIPSFYSLTAPHEFTAEIICKYITRKSSVKNKALIKLIKEALNVIR